MTNPRYDPPAMDRGTHLRQDASNAAGLDHSKLWRLVFLGLCAWQLWLTLSLFAPADTPHNEGMSTVARWGALAKVSWERLTSEEPIVSGRHPLHLYFGYLGSQTFRERGTLCCYDPAFQAGYPKTPVFDAGSRPAELFLFLAGPAFRPAAYKLGLCACCALLPIFLAIAAKGFGLGRGSTCLATALGLLITWSTPSRATLDAGDLDLLLGGAASLSFVGSLLAYHRNPHLGNWLGLLLLGCLGWFAHPLLWLLLIPLILVYYLSIGARHQFIWHFGLATSLSVPVAINSFWLRDWLQYWWIRLPLQLETATLKHRTFHTMWSCPLWGDSGDRVLGIALLTLGFLGVIVLNHTRQRVTARVVGLGAGGFFALTVVGLAWEPLGQLGAVQLLTPALWLAVLPSVHLLRCLMERAACWSGSSGRVTLYLLLAVGGGAACLNHEVQSWATGLLREQPLALGLGPARRDLIQVLRTHTTSESRILWEDLPCQAANPRWSVLLPMLTDRAFIGGLSPDGCIEHAYCGLVDQALLGRPISSWSDAELDDYCRHYNVGWIVAWSANAIERLKKWRGNDAGIKIHDDVPGYLFPVGVRSYVLKGSARLIRADRGQIALTDVVPDDEGVVLLAFHYQAGMHASPARIQVEREPDPADPIPFLRLRVSDPTPLVTITWDERR